MHTYTARLSPSLLARNHHGNRLLQHTCIHLDKTLLKAPEARGATEGRGTRPLLQGAAAVLHVKIREGEKSHGVMLISISFLSAFSIASLAFESKSQDHSFPVPSRGQSSRPSPPCAIVTARLKTIVSLRHREGKDQDSRLPALTRGQGSRLSSPCVVARERLKTTIFAKPSLSTNIYTASCAHPS
ncbi:hypothetical protein BS78_02G085000 [Paspalum vaginatum]|nr:hypothetical protein BS78_02G085000 [Paspalum vaginatum]